MRSRSRTALAGVLSLLLFVSTACGSTDDGAAVREITGSGDGATPVSGSDSAPSAGSGSSSAVAAEPTGTTEADGGYDYASSVDSHRLVMADLCPVGDLLAAGDFESVAAIYRDGVNSIKSDGSVRTIAGFATQDDALHGLASYYGTPTPLDDFVSAALEGTGLFEGQTGEVRAQAVAKGMQNQVMVAWVQHEIALALTKAEEGNFDPAEGAVHNWDEAWAFYHGSEPGCSPFATANSRGSNFGTVGQDGETALANEAILAAMIDGRDALVAEDAESAGVAAREVRRNLAITYSQAAVRYASLIENDLADGDEGAARTHQAEGLAFWRVVESMMADAGADADAINKIYDLAGEPGSNGFGEAVAAALEPAWAQLGISDADIGELQ